MLGESVLSLFLSEELSVSVYEPVAAGVADLFWWEAGKKKRICCMHTVVTRMIMTVLDFETRFC